MSRRIFGIICLVLVLGIAAAGISLLFLKNDDTDLSLMESTKKYKLVIASSIGGTAEGDGMYAEGETVSLVASAVNAGYVFIGWSSPDGIAFVNDKAEATTFIMPAANITVTASFEYRG